MSHTYASIIVHIVFSTKHRQPFLIPNRRPQVFAYMEAILRRLGCTVFAINGVADHVHVVTTWPPASAFAHVVGTTKACTSKWIHEARVLTPAFEWQRGYSAFSVSASCLTQVVDYVERQETHHRKRDFQEELRALLTLHGIVFDERYLWD